MIRRQMLRHHGEGRTGSVTVSGVSSGVVLPYVTQVINRLLVCNAKNNHRGVVSYVRVVSYVVYDIHFKWRRT